MPTLRDQGFLKGSANHYSSTPSSAAVSLSRETLSPWGTVPKSYSGCDIEDQHVCVTLCPLRSAVLVSRSGAGVIAPTKALWQRLHCLLKVIIVTVAQRFLRSYCSLCIVLGGRWGAVGYVYEQVAVDTNQGSTVTKCVTPGPLIPSSSPALQSLRTRAEGYLECWSDAVSISPACAVQ